jgi:hypothetical protein
MRESPQGRGPVLHEVRSAIRRQPCNGKRPLSRCRCPVIGRKSSHGRVKSCVNSFYGFKRDKHGRPGGEASLIGSAASYVACRSGRNAPPHRAVYRPENGFPGSQHGNRGCSESGTVHCHTVTSAACPPLLPGLRQAGRVEVLQILRRQDGPVIESHEPEGGNFACLSNKE